MKTTANKIRAQAAALPVWLAAAVAGTAGELSWNFHFSADDVGLAAKGEYTVVSLAGGDAGSGKPGLPGIPAKFADFLLPAGASNVTVTATGNLELLAGDVVPYPVQPPRSPSKTAPGFVPPDPASYGASAPWPGELARCEGIHDMQGERFVSVRVNPLRYVGSEKELWLCPDLTVRIAYDVPARAPVLRRSARQAELAGEMADALVLNPRGTSAGSGKRGAKGAADVDYLIITSGSLSNAFKKLADYRATAAGGAYRTRVATVESIGATYSGSDIQAKIRACISNHAATCGTSYVVLGGDDSVVPDRDCHACVFLEEGPCLESHMPTDLYYSDLTGSWKASGASEYGTVAAGVDMAPDVIVGRIPVRTAAQAGQYIDKLKKYETGEHPTDKLLLSASELGQTFTGSARPTDDVTGDGHPGFRADKHASVSDSEQWVRRLYRDGIRPYWAAKVSLACDTITSWDSGTCGDAAFTAANLSKWLNLQWTHFVFVGHGNTQSLSMEYNGNFTPSDAASLTGLVACVYTTACLSGAFDEDGINPTGVTTDIGTSEEKLRESEPCVAEGFLRNATGGALAYIGCARFGWFAFGSDTGGDGVEYCSKFEKRLHEAEAQSSNRTIGKAFALHKADMIKRCSEDGTCRWLQYGLNLLGDPALVLQPRGEGPAMQEVTFDAHGGTCGTARQTYTVGEVYGWLPEATLSGYVFLGWFTAASGGEEVTAASTVGAVASLALHAHWEKAPSTTQTVTFDAAGGTCAVSSREYAIGGKYGQLPVATWTGHVFTGWFTADGREITADTIVSAATTLVLHAEWKSQPKTQTVTFDPTGGSCPVATQEYTVGAKYGWLPTPSKFSWVDVFHNISYAFRGWYTEIDGGVAVGTDSTVTAEETRTLYAHWVASKSETFYFYGNGGTPVQQYRSYVVGGPFGEFPGVSWVDHTFDGWFTEASGGTRVDESDTVPETGLSFYAHWTAAPSQTVTFNANGGECRTAGESYIIGSPYGWLPTAVWAGHRFAGWFTAASGGDQITTASIVEPVATLVLFAQWVEDGGAFWLSGFNPGVGGEVPSVRFLGVKGTTYQLQWTPKLDVADSDWKWVGEPVLAAGGGEEEVALPSLPSSEAGFFRLAQGGETPAERYMVVDMGGGAAAKNWPVSYLDKVPAGGWTNAHKTTNLVLRWIDAGTFRMGSPTNELGRSSGEKLHDVTLTDGFWMGVFEVTQRQWELVMGNNPSYNKGDLRPVDKVGYHDIRGTGAGTNWPTSGQVDSDSFLGVLRAKTGLEFDLPTEAQWEYACRAGTDTALNSGKDLTSTNACPNLDELARYQGNYSDGKGGYKSRQTTVGSYLPNAWGLYDMHGNVQEWCLDWYSSGYSTEAVTNPAGAGHGTHAFRILRGGSWSGTAKYCRSAARDGWTPDSGSMQDGFRLACSSGP